MKVFDKDAIHAANCLREVLGSPNYKETLGRYIKEATKAAHHRILDATTDREALIAIGQAKELRALTDWIRTVMVAAQKDLQKQLQGEKTHGRRFPKYSAGRDQASPES